MSDGTLTFGQAMKCVRSDDLGFYGQWVSEFTDVIGKTPTALKSRTDPGLKVGGTYRLVVTPVLLDPIDEALMRGGSTADHPSSPGDRTGLG